MARSPNYPGVDLKFAVERAERIWKAQQARDAATEVVMKNLGYARRSGAGSVTYGALKRFGLLADEGGRAKLTPLGIEIVEGETTGRRDYDKLREAALQPKAHKEIWELYQADLPDDSVIEFDLVKKGFTEGGAKEFLAQWKRTLLFAKLAESSASVSENDSNGNGERAESPPVANPPPKPDPPMTPASNRQYGIPLVDGDAALIVPPRMTEASWDQMLAVIEAMKPGIVRQAPNDAQGD